MGTSAQSISARIIEVDRQIHELKAQLQVFQEERQALVDTLAGMLGTEAKVEFEIGDSRLTARPRTLVSFPTKIDDPKHNEMFIAAIKSNGLWDRFSMICYARLRSEWLLPNSQTQSWRRPLSQFAQESVTLKVTTGKSSTAYTRT